MSSLTDFQYLANPYDVICLQESFLLPSSRFNILGFHVIRRDVTSPGIRGLCVLIRDNFLFSILDASCFFHPSIEVLSFLVYCSWTLPF